MRKRHFLASIVIIGVFLASGCSASFPAGDSIHFARANARVVIGAGDTFPLNFLLVADSKDGLFDDYDGIEIADAGTFDADEAALERGDTRKGRTLANISVNMDASQIKKDLEFSEVKVLFKSGKSQLFNVGEWKVTVKDLPDPVISEGEGWPAVLPSCQSFQNILKNESNEAVSDIRLGLVDDTIGLSSSLSLDSLDPKGKTTLTASLKCNSDFDVYAVTPELSYKTRTGQSSQMLPVMLIGFMDISDQDIDRIAAR